MGLEEGRETEQDIRRITPPSRKSSRWFLRIGLLLIAARLVASMTARRRLFMAFSETKSDPTFYPAPLEFQAEIALIISLPFYSFIISLLSIRVEVWQRARQTVALVVSLSRGGHPEGIRFSIFFEHFSLFSSPIQIEVVGGEISLLFSTFCD